MSIKNGAINIETKTSEHEICFERTNKHSRWSAAVEIVQASSDVLWNYRGSKLSPQIWRASDTFYNIQTRHYESLSSIHIFDFFPSLHTYFLHWQRNIWIIFSRIMFESNKLDLADFLYYFNKSWIQTDCVSVELMKLVFFSENNDPIKMLLHFARYLVRAGVHFTGAFTIAHRTQWQLKINQNVCWNADKNDFG